MTTVGYPPFYTVTVHFLWMVSYIKALKKLCSQSIPGEIKLPGYSTITYAFPIAEIIEDTIEERPEEEEEEAAIMPESQIEALIGT